MKLKIFFLILGVIFISFALNLSSSIIETAENKNKIDSGDKSVVISADNSSKADAPSKTDNSYKEELANQIFFEIRHVDDPAEKAILYRKVADECRGIEHAEEALWILSQLYLNDFEVPNVKEAIACLEQFIKLYPNSEWRSHVEFSLLGLYENEEFWEKVIVLCEKIIKDDSNMPSRIKEGLTERYMAAKVKVNK